MIDRERLQTDVQRILGAGQLLEERLPGFRHRDGQLAMAREVADVLADRGILVAEGGTGIGKTLAYLVPAILSGEKVVVATGTKTLQEQVYFKDLPQLLEAVNLGVRATYMKGRANYLCLLRYRQFAGQRLFRFAAEGPLFDEIERWAAVTDTGDRAELPELPDNYATWSELTSTSESCLGSRCRFYHECFVTRMRKRAAEADLIIVNHHLYLADLAVRERAFGEVIPDHDVVIFDEAHQLESVATQHFGTAVSNTRIYSMGDDILRWMNPKKKEAPLLRKIIEELRADTVNFFQAFSIYSGRFSLGEGAIDGLIMDRYYKVDGHLDGLYTKLKQLGEESDEAATLAERVHVLAGDLALLMGERREDYVYWGEVRRRSVALAASPLDVAPLMQEHFFSKGRTAVFTSATLSAGKEFAYFRERIGVPEEARQAVFPSPFDYRHQSMLFLPRVMPEPQHPQFTARMAELVAQLVRVSNGAALILFTSYANMEAVYEKLADKLPYPLLKQGDAPRNSILERFRETTNSVLFATGTFWQGVDVLGESLRLLVIDKLPFESPSEPIVEARIGYMKQQGKNAFMDYQVPAAIIQLKQGMGRLIRDGSDWGVMALMDRRVITKRYGKRFLDALPPAIRAERLDEVETWWKRRSAIDAQKHKKDDRKDWM